MKTGTKIYVVKIVLKWSDRFTKITNDGLTHGDSIGSAPVFDDYETMRKHFPHHEYWEAFVIDKEERSAEDLQRLVE